MDRSIADLAFSAADLLTRIRQILAETTANEYDIAQPDQTIAPGESITASMAGSGLLTIFADSGAPPPPTPTSPPTNPFWPRHAAGPG